MTDELNVFMKIIRSAIIEDALLCAEEKGLCNSDNLLQMLKMAKHHDIAHLFSFGLVKNGLLANYKEIFEKEIFSAVYRYEKSNYELNILCKELEKAQIPFMLLKGSVIRKYYPEPWMRTSCDIDVLVHKHDLERAIKHLENNLEYKTVSKNTHDVSLFSKGGIHIEIHYNLLEAGRVKSSAAVLNHVWDTATVREGFNHLYEMSDAMFYFYHMSHMAKHIECGGCGIRPFIDILILNNNIRFDRDQRQCLLERGELIVFASNAELLSSVWFGNAEHTNTTKQLEHYILQGGVYGTMESKVAIEQSSKGGKFQYAFSRLIVPYELLKINYPIIESHKWLTPFMEVKRWIRLLFSGRFSYAVKELNCNNNVSRKTVVEMRKFLKNVGL